jgi:HAD superfamily hydrolase (TIGR01509 family)
VLEGVVFDMDGVLVDSHGAHLKAWRLCLRDMGRDVSDEELQIVLDGRTRREILEHLFGRLSEDELVAFSISKDKHFNALAGEILPVPGALEFVSALKLAGIPAALATSASRLRAEQMLERFRLRSNFAAVATGSDVERGKPDPAIFSLAAEQLALCPQNLVAIDDAVSGVRAARAAGMKCIGMGPRRRAASLRAAGAQKIWENFSGIDVARLTTLFSS